MHAVKRACHHMLIELSASLLLVGAHPTSSTIPGYLICFISRCRPAQLPLTSPVANIEATQLMQQQRCYVRLPLFVYSWRHGTTSTIVAMSYVTVNLCA